MLLRPGRTCDEATRFFDSLQHDQELTLVRNSIPRVAEPNWMQSMSSALLRYTEWTARVSRRIREVVDDPGIATRPRSDTYWIIVASDPALQRTISMLHTEIQELSAFFMECANELRTQKERFGPYRGPCIILDTNDFLHYQRFDKIPWRALYGANSRVVIPHVVVDEIDGKSYSEGGKIAKRARGVYRVIEGYLDDIDSQGAATLSDGSTFEILADEPGHRRLPNNDDEIVARAAFVQQAIAPRNAILITRDIGMRTRARSRMLKAQKLPDKYLIPEDQLTATRLDADVASIDFVTPVGGEDQAVRNADLPTPPASSS